jgi:hypothetical protein
LVTLKRNASRKFDFTLEKKLTKNVYRKRDVPDKDVLPAPLVSAFPFGHGDGKLRPHVSPEAAVARPRAVDEERFVDGRHVRVESLAGLRGTRERRRKMVVPENEGRGFESRQGVQFFEDFVT